MTDIILEFCECLHPRYDFCTYYRMEEFNNKYDEETPLTLASWFSGGGCYDEIGGMSSAFDPDRKYVYIDKQARDISTDNINLRKVLINKGDLEDLVFFIKSDYTGEVSDSLASLIEDY